MLTSYAIAAALTALLFVTFVALRRRGCDGGETCGTHARCAGCPHQDPQNEESEHLR